MRCSVPFDERQTQEVGLLVMTDVAAFNFYEDPKAFSSDGSVTDRHHHGGHRIEMSDSRRLYSVGESMSVLNDFGTNHFVTQKNRRQLLPSYSLSCVLVDPRVLSCSDRVGQLPVKVYPDVARR